MTEDFWKAEFARENAALKHDIERYLEINSELATENAALRKRVGFLEKALVEAKTQSMGAALLIESVADDALDEASIEAKAAIEDK